MALTEDPTRDGAPPPNELAFVTYAEFGQRFFETAVTKQRITDAVSGIAGQPIDVGPLGVGPMGLVKVRATGAVGTPTVEDRADPEHVAFDLMIPVDLQMLIEISFDKHRFDAKVFVRLALTARAAEPLQVVIEVEPPTKRNVEVEVTADGLRASVLQVIAGVDDELKRSVAKFVRSEIDKPELQRSRVIDVAKALESLSTRR